MSIKGHELILPRTSTSESNEIRPFNLKTLCPTFRGAAILFDRSYKPWMRFDKFLKLFKSTRVLDRVYSHLYTVIKALIADHERDFQLKVATKGRKLSPFLDLFYTLRETMDYEQTLEAVLNSSLFLSTPQAKFCRAFFFFWR
jgi:hypothetical protein